MRGAPAQSTNTYVTKGSFQAGSGGYWGVQVHESGLWILSGTLAGKFRLGYRDFALALPIQFGCPFLRLLCGASGGIVVWGPLALLGWDAGLWAVAGVCGRFCGPGPGMALSGGGRGLWAMSKVESLACAGLAFWGLSYW